MREAVIGSLLLMGCFGASTAKDGPATEPDPTDVATHDTAAAYHVADTLYGVVPNRPAALPEFTATNHDGVTRDRDDILGKPTVMWFFPSAGTFG